MTQVESTTTQALLCYQCSKCSSVCPAFRIGEFVPRSLVLEVMTKGMETAAQDKTIWGCKTCGNCLICPMMIDIPTLVLDVRAYAFTKGNLPPETKTEHRRIFSLAQRLMARGTPATVSWPLNHQKHVEKGPVGLFAGLLPVWDQLMYNYELDLTTGLRAVLEALNTIGVIPAIPPGFKDSGHDMYHGGDRATFLTLAEHNRDIIKKAGIETLVVINPEDYYMLKTVYPRFLTGFSTKIVFWTEYLVENAFIDKAREKAFFFEEVVAAYHDPCKLGRLSKIYDSPRKILENIPGVRLVSLRNEREYAPCCGVTGFLGCDDGSLYLRHERIAEVLASGASVLVTACPSCASHYTCASASMPDQALTVVDLATLLGKQLFKLNRVKP